MPDLTPASPPPNVSLSVSGGGQAQSGALALLGGAQIVQLPDKLQSITRSVVLGGQVTGQNTDGTVTLRTAVGDVVVRPNLPLPPGQQTITIQIQSGSPPSLGALYAPLNLPSGTSAAQMPNININMSGAASIQDTIVTTPTVNLPSLQNLVEGAVVTASVLPESSEAIQNFAAGAPLNATPLPNAPLLPNTAVPGASPLPPGVIPTQLEDAISATLPVKSFPEGNMSASPSLSPRLLETVQQTVNLINQQNPGAAQTAALQNQFAQNPSALVPPVQLTAETLPPGSQIVVQITQMTMPAASGAQIAQSIPSSQNLPAAQAALQAAITENITPGQVNSNVALQNANTAAVMIEGKILSVSTSPNAIPQTIVETPFGNLALPGTTSLPPGSKIMLQWLPPSAVQAEKTTQVPLVPLNLAEGKGWPALETVLETLMAQNSPTAAQVLNSMPKLDNNFPATALLFMIGLRSGNIKNWLGENGAGEHAEDILSKIKDTKALDILSKDFAGLKGAKVDAQGGEWKLYTLPFLNDQGLSRMQLAVRDHYEPLEEGESMADTRVTRFVVDVNFSEMGEVQLDGFMRDKKLDLIVRTQDALPQDMRRELLGVYNDTLGSQGLNGTLSFQAGYQNWIKLMQKQRGSGVYSA